MTNLNKIVTTTSIHTYIQADNMTNFGERKGCELLKTDISAKISKRQHFSKTIPSYKV